jgi:hypothetical protein
LRTKYFQAKKQFSSHKTIANKICLTKASKSYKKCIFKAHSQNKFKTEQKMKLLRSDDPKEFYKIFKVTKRRENNVPPVEDFFNYFSELTRDESTDTVPNINFDDIVEQVGNDDMLNGRFNEDEINKSIKQLKNNKAAGSDKIINEYIKSTAHILLPFYVRLFNILLDHGVYPEEWLTGIIIPIYKNKGSNLSPENYRPITLLCCCSKLFTNVLNNRLNTFIEQNDIMSEAQAAFRKGYSTIDHLFTLNTLINI